LIFYRRCHQCGVYLR